MFSFIKNHPFPVTAFFESSLVLTFAVPRDELISRIPDCLSLETFCDKWAFIAVALVNTKGLRPTGFPKFLGNDFILIGYRIFVNYTDASGKKFRGLYILKSETNKRKMEVLGNVFTHYNYTTTDIQWTTGENRIKILSEKSVLKLEVETNLSEVALPRESPFADWKEARRFAGPLPFTFGYNAEAKEILIVEGVRQDWIPNPVKVIDYKFPYLTSLNLKEITLANAFNIRNIPYRWKRGRISKWSP